MIDSSPYTVAECLSLADAAFIQGDTAATIKHLMAACALDPLDANLELVLGNVHLGNSEFARAIHHYLRALKRQPDLDTAHACVALAFQLKGQSADAQKAALTALGINPANDVALKVLARISLDAQRFDRARSYCDCVLRRNPSDADALEIRAQCTAPAALGASSPAGLLGDFGARTRAWEQLGSEHLLQQFVVGLEPTRVVIQQRPSMISAGPDGLPTPPVGLRMGYCGNDTAAYFELGRKSYASLQRILASHKVTLGAGDAMLDWGCASGRVIRNFLPEARRGCAVWGADVHAPSMVWAKAHLTPFRFFNCSSLPHLPFADGTFKFIYALSVLTHIVALRDLWLLELARVLRSDGCAILTIHDEATWALFQRDGQPGWMPRELHNISEMPGECVDIQGSTWDQTYTFFHSDYIRRSWGQYFEVAEIIPGAESHQTAVVLRKR